MTRAIPHVFSSANLKKRSLRSFVRVKVIKLENPKMPTPSSPTNPYELKLAPDRSQRKKANVPQK